MKSMNLYRAFLLGILIAGSSSFLKSQTCGMSYPLTNGSTWTMTNYDDKGNVEGTTISLVTNSISSDEGTVATIQSKAKDNKDIELGTSHTAVKCVAGNIFIEMKSFIPAQSLERFKNMNIKSDGTWLEIPQILTIGMALPDASAMITIYNDGEEFNIKLSIANRTVADKETITTAAGTFDCYKITQDFNMEMVVRDVSIPTNMITTEYYAADTGLIKSETYNNDSKLLGYSELTSITKK